MLSSHHEKGSIGTAASESRDWSHRHSVRRCLTRTSDHEAGRTLLRSRDPIADSAYRQTVDGSSPTTGTILHEAVISRIFGADCHIGETAVLRNSLPTSNLEKCGVPNGIFQRGEPWFVLPNRGPSLRCLGIELHGGPMHFQTCLPKVNS